MPEGDTIYRTAATLRKALLNQSVRRFETSLLSVEAVVRRWPLAGRVVSAVEARGKHLLISFTLPKSEVPPGENSTSSEPLPGSAAAPLLLLHTHMRMIGSWHVYRPGEPWQKPARYAKVVIHTEGFVTPCFSAPVVELLTEREASRHPDLLTLGPDASTAQFDPEEVLARLRRHPDVPIGVALLNQRLLAGVGNIFKSEVLFVGRVSPFARVGDLSEKALRGLVGEAQRLLTVNREGGIRRTVFGLNERERLWVYGRAGERCRACGNRIQMRRQGVDARSTYFCPACQSADSQGVVEKSGLFIPSPEGRR